ncbi:uncharacterized protein DS421_16g527090 [Arachis hypogaea]|nr:uncharacterized protein DS421_16g527090 [Arachis hypogaea]
MNSKVFVLMVCLLFTYAAATSASDATKVVEIIPATASGYYHVLGSSGSELGKCDTYCLVFFLKVCCDSYSLPLPRKMASYA